MKILLILALSGCWFGKSAAETTGVKDVYCEPLHQDIMKCHDEDGVTYICTIDKGVWVCSK